MTSKERVLAAINHKETDRIPITFDADDAVYELLYKHLMVNSKEKLFDRLNVDTWMILPGNFIYTAGEEQKEEKTSIWGYRVKVTRHSAGHYDALTNSPLAGKNSIADIRAYSWPSPEILDFSHFRYEALNHYNRATIGVFTWGAFFIACYVRGMEDLMIDFASRRKYIDHLFTTINEISAESLNHMLRDHGEDIDIIYMCDDYCSQSGPLFSPADFKTFVFPYLKQLVGITHQYNKKFLLHVCGAVRPLLPLIIKAGVDILEPIQTRAAGMEPSALKKDFGKDICFYGGVDLQQLLPKGTKEQVSEEVKRLIDILGRDGGYILGPGHTYIQADAPLENIFTMYDTAFTYRRN
jgi:uroporphyrinogen decarboxylase